MHEDLSDAYASRFERVFAHIERHLDDALTLEQLSAVANFSRFHFHRQFAAYCGMPVARYIQRLRLKRASYRLAFNPQEKVIDIALDAGFQSPEAFSRAFRQLLGKSPTQFRRQPDWIEWHQHIREPQPLRSLNMKVEIVDFPTTQIAVLRHHGQPELINASAAQFIAWRKQSGLSPVASSQTYGIAPLDPGTTRAEDFYFDICGSVLQPIAEDNPYGVRNGLIPGGRCAVLRHQGAHDRLTDAARALYRDWLPTSGASLRDFPLYFHYLNFVHEVAEHALLTDIYLPLA